MKAPGTARPLADAVAPPPRHPRFPLIDGMRAVAVLSVVGVHVALAGQAVDSTLPGRLLAHLNIGVTIFFYYLVERPLLRLKYRTLHDVLRRRRGPVQTAN